MDIKAALGLKSDKKVRYAVVALGDIAQEAMLPGIEHTGNSEVVAFVTSDPDKAREMAAEYNVDAIYNYHEFPELIASGSIDAIYLAMPNWRHAEFAIPALKAGIHVLVEKPLEVSVAKAQELVDAQQASSAKLMVAYRLHFEPGTLDLIKKIRSGELGQVHFFSSAFAQVLDPENHRNLNGDLAGPVLDMGPYPINAARHIFASEPTEVVSAVGTRHAGSKLGDFDDTVAVTLKFPEGCLAQFTISYYGSAIDSYCVVGTKGNVTMSPGFLYGSSIEQQVTIGQDKDHKSFKNTDQFGGEMKYFSNCILHNLAPEPDGEEGLADVRVIEGILEALKTGGSVKLPPFTRSRRIDPEQQEETLSAKRSPDLVKVSNPGRDMEKIPMN
jgi:predicted dehydrogenase